MEELKFLKGMEKGAFDKCREEGRISGILSVCFPVVGEGFAHGSEEALQIISTTCSEAQL